MIEVENFVENEESEKRILRSDTDGKSVVEPLNDAAVVEYVRQGGSLSSAATRFGISRAKVTALLKEKAIACESTESDQSETESSSKSKNTSYQEIEQTVASNVSMKRPAPSSDVHGMGEMELMLVQAGMGTAIQGGNAFGAPKLKRVRKTREEKLAILQFVDQGGTHVAAAEKFGVSRTAVTKMVKERDLIMGGIHTVPPINNEVPTHRADSEGLLSVKETSTPVDVTANNGMKKEKRSNENAEGTKTTKARRVRKTNEEKLEILAFLERCGSQGEAAVKFGVSRTAVTKMVKEKEAIAAQVHSGTSTHHRKVLQYQHKLSIIEDMLYKWQIHVEQETPHFKITGDILQTKAIEFRDKILSNTATRDELTPEIIQSLTDFKASNGWLHRYLQRRNVRGTTSTNTVSTDNFQEQLQAAGGGRNTRGRGRPSNTKPVNTNILETWMEAVRRQLSTVPLECIWNLDEIAIRPHGISSATLTVTLLVNAAGSKGMLHIVTHEAIADPSHVSMSHMICTQPQGLQDTMNFALYLQAISELAKAKGETWYILIDTSAAHMAFAQLVDPTGSMEMGFRFDSLILLVMPLSTDPTIQAQYQLPIQHGISKAFRAAFRLEMTQAFLLQDENADSIPCINVIKWIIQAWETIPTIVIQQGWILHRLLSSNQFLAVLSSNQLNVLNSDVSNTITNEFIVSITTLLTAAMTQEGDNNEMIHKIMRILGLVSPPSTITLDMIQSWVLSDQDAPTELVYVSSPKTKDEDSCPMSMDVTNTDLRALV